MSFNFTNPSKLFAWFYSLFCPFYGRKYYKELLKFLNLQGNESILDFGSGTGVLAKMLVKELNKGGTLTCMDLSRAFLNRTQKKLRKNSNVDYILGDILEMELPAMIFDKIISTWVFHHIEDKTRSQVVKKLGNLLKPDGEFYLIEFLAPPHGIESSELTNYFEKIGFKSQILFQNKNTVLFNFKK